METDTSRTTAQASAEDMWVSRGMAHVSLCPCPRRMSPTPHLQLVPSLAFSAEFCILKKGRINHLKNTPVSLPQKMRYFWPSEGSDKACKLGTQVNL